MTVDQVLEETRRWPPNQIDALVKALTEQPKLTKASQPASPNFTVSSFKEFADKLDALWAGSNVNYTNEDIVALIRESRGSRG